MPTATLTKTGAPTRRVRPRSIREIRILHRDADSEAPNPGDAVEVAGRTYVVTAGNPEGEATSDRPEYLYVHEARS